MPSPLEPTPPTRDLAGKVPFRDLLTFERALTRPVTLLIYWSGLGLIALIGFGLIGVAVGVALRGDGWEALLAVPAFVFGALLVTALALLWRGASEFYVAVFRIADELTAVRQRLDQLAEAPAPPLAPPVAPPVTTSAPAEPRPLRNQALKP